MKTNKPLAFEQVLENHNISRPVKRRKALIRLFSGRTNRITKISIIIDATKLLIALKQSAPEKQKDTG